jgi:hypothetical protein
MGDNGSILVMSSSNTFPGQSMGASDNYRTAYGAFEQALATDASTAEVRLNFQTLAGVSATERTQASTICRRYVDVSRVLSVRDYDSDKPAGEKLMAQPAVLPAVAVGLDKYASALVIAPNPTTGLLQVQAPEIGGTLEVFNALGQVVLRLTVVDQQSKVDLAGEHDGVYLLKWTSENGQEQQVTKIVLQR